MDYTRTYFKMSDHPIIQDQFNYESGNLVARKTGKDFKAVFVLADHNKKYIRNMNQRWAVGHYVWMPRRDEIQKLFGSHFGIDDIMAPVCHFASSLLSERPEDDYLRFDTPEKCWLAFYMKEIHGLMWRDEKWQKER